MPDVLYLLMPAGAGSGASPRGGAAGGGFDADELLPRSDISLSITSALMANLSSSNWKERKEAMDSIEGLITSAGGRIQPQVCTNSVLHVAELVWQAGGTFGPSCGCVALVWLEFQDLSHGSRFWYLSAMLVCEIDVCNFACGCQTLHIQVGELFSGLKARMADSNKNLVVQALSLVGKLAKAMGKGINRSGSIVLAPALKNLSDNKHNVRIMLPCLMSGIEAPGFEV